MRKSRFSEEQILGILRLAEAGQAVHYETKPGEQLQVDWGEFVYEQEARMKRLLAAGALAAARFGSTVGTALAAAHPRPSGTGQPSQTCLSQTTPSELGNAASALGSEFNENGGMASSDNAGTDVSATTGGSGNTVSQYNMVCSQVTQPRPKGLLATGWKPARALSACAA